MDICERLSDVLNRETFSEKNINLLSEFEKLDNDLSKIDQGNNKTSFNISPMDTIGINIKNKIGYSIRSYQPYCGLTAGSELLRL
tara:strand:+ start:671 stop:925 length:255 start_codon:yes stop_codon:yes gene_type:complete